MGFLASSWNESSGWFSRHRRHAKYWERWTKAHRNMYTIENKHENLSCWLPKQTNSSHSSLYTIGFPWYSWIFYFDSLHVEPRKYIHLRTLDSLNVPPVVGKWPAINSSPVHFNQKSSAKHMKYTYVYIYMCKYMQIVFQVNSSSSKHEIFQEPNGIIFRLGAKVRSLYTNRHKLYYNKQ